MNEIEKYFSELSSKQQTKFKQLNALYKVFNNQVNLISKKDIDNLYLHHILHSLAIAKFIKFNSKAKVLDVGTGGGFPGIPLAIFFPDVHFTLVDSILKKIIIVEKITEQLGLKNVKCKCKRVENLNIEFDFVVARAVAPFPKLIKWVENKIRKKNNHSISNGIIALKGGELRTELNNFPDSQIIELKTLFTELYFNQKKLVYLPLNRFKVA